MASVDDSASKAKDQGDKHAPDHVSALDKLLSQASRELEAKSSSSQPNKSSNDNVAATDKLPTKQMESGDRSVKQLSELFSTVSQTPGIKFLDRHTTYYGEKADLLGFDKASGAAVINRAELADRNADLRTLVSSSGQIKDSEGRTYQTLDLGAAQLYKDGNGAIFTKAEENGRPVLKELPGLQSVALSDRRLSINKESDDVFKGKLSIAYDVQAAPGRDLPGGGKSPGEFLDHLADVLDKPTQNKLSPLALAQSNDYATRHEFSGKLEDGFRSAGQLRQFSADGTFSATDRAATVVDRSQDPKLRNIIEDAKTQFSDLPPRERAQALAEYVNKLMGPADGNERALDQRYRQLMQDNAGKSMLLSDFLGTGACTQRALLLKVLADETGLDSSIVRGNGGTHVWNTFRFPESKGKSEIFDTRGGIYGVESSPLLKPNTPGDNVANASDFVAGQNVVVNGKDWQISGYNTQDGRINLSRSEQITARPEDLQASNPNASLDIGSKYLVKSANGKQEEYALQGKNPDGSLILARSENISMARKELAESVLELGTPTNDNIRFLKDNWQAFVENNSKLNKEQKADLSASLELASQSKNPTAAIDFRKLVEAIGKLKDAKTPDVQQRVNALSSLANTTANHSESVFLPVDRLINAKDTGALVQVAESLAQSAPYGREIPKNPDGTINLRGDGYEHAAGQALERALLDKSALDKMVKEGKLPPGEWVFVPSAKSSTADNMKFDGMLVDLQSGKAAFIDFAMQEQGNNPYKTLVKKLAANNNFGDGTPKQPWALTLDNSSIGRDPASGASSGKIDAQKILERLGSYLKGEQPQALNLPGITQAKPELYDLAELKSKLGGRFFSFAPVQSQLEADVLSQGAKTVLTTEAELQTIAKTFDKSDPIFRRFSQSAKSAQDSAEDIASASDFFNGGLRAAVEANKLGGQDNSFKPGITTPSVDFTVNAAEGFKAPDGYSNLSYLKFAGDDSVGTNGKPRQQTEVRIYENGDVLVKPGGGDLRKIGTVSDLGATIGRKLVRDNIDTEGFNERIDALKEVGEKFSKIAGDQAAVKSGTMTAEAFWKKYPELRLVSDGIEHKQASERAAKDGRDVHTTRETLEQKDAVFAKLSDADKDNIARKYAELKQAGQDGLSLDAVRKVIELQKESVTTVDAANAVRFQAAMGKEAEGWSNAELKDNFLKARAAQVDFPTVGDLAQVYRTSKLQAELGVDANTARTVYGIAQLMPNATNTDLLAVNDMFNALKDSRVNSVSIASVVNIYAKNGRLSAAEISEMDRISGKLKNLRPDELATVAVRNIQTGGLYGVDQATADAIRSKATAMIKSGTSVETAHDAAALVLLKQMPEKDAAELAKTLPEVRLRHSFDSFSQMADAATVLHAVRNTAADDNIKGDFERIVADGIAKNGNNLAKIKDFVRNELLERGAGDGAHAESWIKLHDAVDACKTPGDFAKLLNLPSDAAAQKTALEGYHKLFQPNSNSSDAPATAKPEQALPAAAEADLKGSPVFQKLTDETRITESLKQLTDRALQRMPSDNSEKADFLTKQIKAAMRKQLGVATDAELPTNLRNLQIKLVEGDAKAPRVVQEKPGDPAIIEIPSKLLAENAKGVIVDVYTQASGLSMLNILHEKGNMALTMRSLQPFLSKIATQAEQIVGARSEYLANQTAKPVSSDAASSDRVVTAAIDTHKLVTSWDGANLTFGGEKFEIKTEIEKLEKERGDKIKDLEEQVRKAKELADASKKVEDSTKVQSLETQLANERQNLKVTLELRLALNGQQGNAAQERARSLVKNAADRAIEESIRPRGRGGAELSRGAAIAMVVSTLAFMFANSTPSQADTYSGSFRG